MIHGVVVQKLQSLDMVLAELRSWGAISVSQLNDDWCVRRAIERVFPNHLGARWGGEAVSGRAVHCRDVGRRAVFVSLAAREYEDELALMQQFLRP